MAKTQLREVLWHNAQGLASVQRKEGCAGLLRDVEEGGAPLVGVGLVRVFYEEKSPTNYPQIVTACASIPSATSKASIWKLLNRRAR